MGYELCIGSYGLRVISNELEVESYWVMGFALWAITSYGLGCIHICVFGVMVYGQH